MCIVLETKKYHIDAALSSDPIKDTRISTECGCTEQTTLFFVEMYFAPSGVFSPADIPSLTVTALIKFLLKLQSRHKLN